MPSFFECKENLETLEKVFEGGMFIYVVGNWAVLGRTLAGRRSSQ
jgi:hypothetical protein